MPNKCSFCKCDAHVFRVSMPLAPQWSLAKSGMGHTLGLFSGCACLCLHRGDPNSLSSGSCSPNTLLQQAQSTKQINREVVCLKQCPFTPLPLGPLGFLCGPSGTCRDVCSMPVVWQQPLLFLWGPTLSHSQAGILSTRSTPQLGTGWGRTRDPGLASGLGTFPRSAE